MWQSIKSILKKFKIHWLKRGVCFVPREYLGEVNQTEYVKDNESFFVNYTQQNLSATIRRYAHVLEKGIYMSDRRKGFGLVKSEELLKLLKVWDKKYSDVDDATIVWAKNIYKLYIESSKLTNSEKTDIFHTVYTQDQEKAFERVLQNRRSCRNFVADKAIDKKIIEKIINYANFSPSSCDRQTVVTYVLTDKEDISFCESHSSGGKGFLSTTPCCFILCVDMSSYILPAERHLAYVDGGIYAQSLMLAAEVNGVSTCFLNWASQTQNDEKALRSRFNILKHFVIIGLIAAGYSVFEPHMPPRKNISESLRFVDEK